MELEKEVQCGLDNFKKSYLKCDRERDCLPLYSLKDYISEIKLGGEKVKRIIERGLKIYNASEDKSKFFRIIYKIAEDMKDLLYPGEKDIKPECEKSDCPIYSVLRAADRKGDVVGQLALMETFKYKESERNHCDIGEYTGWQLWANRKIMVGGKETTLAAEFRRHFEEHFLAHDI